MRKSSSFCVEELSTSSYSDHGLNLSNLSDGDERFIRESEARGYSKEASEEYLDVLKGRMSYAEFLKNHKDVYEKQQRRMLVNRIIGATKSGKNDRLAYFYNNIKVMSGSIGAKLSNDYYNRSMELADVYIEGFSDTTLSLRKVAMILKFLNKELMERSKDRMSPGRPVSEDDIPRLLTFALFRPNDVAIRKAVYLDDLSHYINRDLIQSLLDTNQDDMELHCILKGIEKVCDEYSDMEMYTLIDPNFKVKYRLLKMYKLRERIQRIQMCSGVLKEKPVSSSIKKYFGIEGVKLYGDVNLNYFLEILDSDILSLQNTCYSIY